MNQRGAGVGSDEVALVGHIALAVLAARCYEALSAIRRPFFFGKVITSVPSDHFAVEASPSIESENANELSMHAAEFVRHPNRQPLARDFRLDLLRIDPDRRDSHFVTIGEIDDLGAFELERAGSAFPAVDQHFVEELVEGALEVCNSNPRRLP